MAILFGTEKQIVHLMILFLIGFGVGIKKSFRSVTIAQVARQFSYSSIADEKVKKAKNLSFGWCFLFLLLLLTSAKKKKLSARAVTSCC